MLVFSPIEVTDYFDGEDETIDNTKDAETLGTEIVVSHFLCKNIVL
jgi:hypothetical protein